MLQNKTEYNKKNGRKLKKLLLPLTTVSPKRTPRKRVTNKSKSGDQQDEVRLFTNRSPAAEGLQPDARGSTALRSGTNCPAIDEKRQINSLNRPFYSHKSSIFAT